MSRILAACLLSMLSALALANPQHFPDRQWMTLPVTGFDIVYPEGLEAEARYVAERMTTYWPELQRSMPLLDGVRRIPIVISSPTLVSNGMVTYDPMHSIFYNRPAPFGGLEWFDVLSVHEGRHLVQVQQPMDTLTGQIAYWFAGENGPGAIILLFYPNWFMEGDAVVTETALTEAGRGRVASFELWLRTHELSRDRYSYDRAMLGTGFESYPYVSPYDLGYFMTAYLRTHHGDRVLDRALKRTANPEFALTFDGAIRQLTGAGLEATYEKTWDELRQRWQHQVDNLDITDVEVLWQSDEEHWRSLYPIAVDGDRILAVEMDLRDGGYLAAVENGELTRLKRLPRRIASHFYSVSKNRGVSYAAGRFCWTDARVHPRFALEVGGDIHCYEPDSDDLIEVTRGGDFTSVAVNDAGDRLVAHHFTEQRHSALVQLNRQGQPLTEIELPPRSLAYDMTPDGEGGWVFVLLDAEGVRFMRWQPAEARLTQLTGPVKGESLRSPQWSDHWLVYTSDRSGLDAVWALNRDTGERYQLTQRPFGNYYVNLDTSNNRLVFSDYTADGHRLVSLPWPGERDAGDGWRAAEAVQAQPTAYSAPLYRPVPQPGEEPDTKPEPYNRWAHAWNLNSWQLTGGDNELALSLHSNNLLNTLTVDTFAGVHWGEGTPIGGVTVNWRRWWPVISASAERTVSDEDDTLDHRLTLDGSLPLSSTRDLWTTVVTPNLGVSYSDRSSTDDNSVWQSTLIGAGLSLSQMHEPAPRDLQSPLAFSTRYNLDWETQSERIQQYNASQLQLPGFVANHHLTLGGQWQDRQTGFTGPGRYIRPAAFTSLDSGEPALDARFNYRFSLGPVDLALGRIWYQRSLELGFDARWMQGIEDDHSAFGVQLTTPSNLLRNRILRIDPTFGLYYRPTTEDLAWTFSFTLGG
ncbi:TolB family protein [Saccharospirillum salsuginis]|uniref:WD40-like Beta Propeller Repeat n=1 Tax=Saccharospirillum salsuginis TaxID=418750 RepID=A0A918KN60_9GAMM|nr:hypothetical protein [Saccharospirillum salsuginis]GGX67357.1 hypothetical protein GCM10007392_38680 [Saccharospirillum salsuginis]